MNTRPLTQLESKNLSKLNTYQFESVLLFLTSTGYKKSIMHTQRPNVPQFERLLSAGDITMDHLIKRKANNRVVEKGPLFKIKSSKISELFFGKPTTYHLV